MGQHTEGDSFAQKVSPERGASVLEQNRTKEMIQKAFSQVFQAKDEVWLEPLCRMSCS